MVLRMISSANILCADPIDVDPGMMTSYLFGSYGRYLL